MFQIIGGLSILLLLGSSFCVDCQNVNNFEIRRTSHEGNEIDTNTRLSERFQSERVRYSSVGKTRNGAWNSRFGRLSRMQQFKPDSRKMLFSGKRSSFNERLSQQRTFEETIITNRRDVRAKMSELTFRREKQNRKLFGPRRMLRVTRDDVRSRVVERADFRGISFPDRSHLSISRRKTPEPRISIVEYFSGFKMVCHFLQVCYFNVKENFTTVLLSTVFLIDFINEVIQSKKKTEDTWEKSTLIPDITTVTKIFS